MNTLETIITSSTNRIDEEEDPLIEGIHEYIGEAKGSNKRRLPLPTSVDEMTKFITTFCIEFMQRSKIKVVDEELSAKQIFANSINEAVSHKSLPGRCARC
jgi:DNA polymerase sigma